MELKLNGKEKKEMFLKIVDMKATGVMKNVTIL